MSLPKNYMRSVRKHTGLAQRDIAYLLTYQPGCLSELEAGRRTPLLRIVFAYQVVFGVSPEKLVPQKFDEVEKAVRTRAAMLADKLANQKQTPPITRRVSLLRKIEKGGTLQHLTAYGNEK